VRRLVAALDFKLAISQSRRFFSIYFTSERRAPLLALWGGELSSHRLQKNVRKTCTSGARNSINEGAEGLSWPCLRGIAWVNIDAKKVTFTMLEKLTKGWQKDLGQKDEN
jgi:hypothetical protein